MEIRQEHTDLQNIEHTEELDFGAYRYYVYALVDGSTTPYEIFYIGKGVGKRLDAHEAEANHGIDLENHPKLDRIRSLKKREEKNNAERQYFLPRIIGRYKSDEEARSVEATLIKFVFGISALTNKVHGAHHMMVRAHNNWDLIAGIDHPRDITSYLRTGEYTANQRRQVIDNNILEKLEMLKECIEQSELGVTVSTPDLKKVQDPLLWIRWQGADVQLALKLQLTGENAVLGIAPLSSSDSDLAAFRSRLVLADAHRPHIERTAYTWSEKKGGAYGSYCLTRDFKSRGTESVPGYPRGFSIDNLSPLIDEIRSVKNLCS